MLEYIAFLSCLEIALLNSVYNEMILKPKQVLCLECVFWRRTYCVCVADGLWKVIDFPSFANVVIRVTQATQR